MRDRILIRDVPLKARVGCTEGERRDVQPILVDIELRCDLAPAATSDSIEEAIDYVRVRHEAARIVSGRSYALIEAIAGAVADGLLEAFPIDEVVVQVRKPSALAEFGIPWAGVEVVRGRRA